MTGVEGVRLAKSSGKKDKANQKWALSVLRVDEVANHGWSSEFHLDEDIPKWQQIQDNETSMKINSEVCGKVSRPTAVWATRPRVENLCGWTCWTVCTCQLQVQGVEPI